jgi:hypothetical protein
VAFLCVILLALIAVEGELLSLGLLTNRPQMIILFVVAALTPMFGLIALKVFFNALFLSHMDTKSSLF